MVDDDPDAEHLDRHIRAGVVVPVQSSSGPLFELDLARLEPVVDLTEGYHLDEEALAWSYRWSISCTVCAATCGTLDAVAREPAGDPHPPEDRHPRSADRRPSCATGVQRAGGIDRPPFRASVIVCQPQSGPRRAVFFRRGRAQGSIRQMPVQGWRPSQAAVIR